MVDNKFFKSSEPISLKELASLADCQIHNGSDGEMISGAATLSKAVKGQISFFTNKKYIADFMVSNATAMHNRKK